MSYLLQPVRHQRGFTIVEILVGMVIALLGILVMAQVSTTFTSFWINPIGKNSNSVVEMFELLWCRAKGIPNRGISIRI